MPRTVLLLLSACCLLAGSPALGLPKGPPRQVDLAAGVFLVADPGMGDPRFARSIVLLLRYDRGGAMGLIVNKRSRVPLTELLPGLPGVEEESLDVHYGGPVRPNRLLFLADRPSPADGPSGEGSVLPGVYVVQGLEGVKAILARDGHRLRAYAGYAGWGAGQLDAELARSDWFVVPADAQSVFADELDGLWDSIHDWLTMPTA